jgi:hypothetical protein
VRLMMLMYMVKSTEEFHESAEICFVRVVLYGAEGRRSAGGKEK